MQEGFPSGWKTAAELQSWRQKYDASPAIVGQSDLGSFQWNECISSDLERALTTARTVFNGNFDKTPLLREAEFAQFQTGNLRLPVLAWRWMVRFSWMTGHKTQRACRDDFRSRVTGVADLLQAKAGNVLVVSHAGMMVFLSAELRRRKFVGPKLKLPRHAAVYVYERHP